MKGITEEMKELDKQVKAAKQATSDATEFGYPMNPYSYTKEHDEWMQYAIQFRKVVDSMPYDTRVLRSEKPTPMKDAWYNALAKVKRKD